MPAATRTFRVFVSSTFSDLKAERDHLQAHVFPQLRDLCRQHGCRFQAIDLRWGVSEEAALDQQTMNICLDELRRCQSTSPRPNFIVLLGQRYGWCPLPPQIPAAEFRELLNAVDSADNRALLCCPDPPAEPQPGLHWYRRDDNANPPEYVLRSREALVPEDGSKGSRSIIRQQDADEWRRLESRVLGILRTAIHSLGWLDHDPRRAKYEQSATHQEIEAGALSTTLDRPDQHVFCFIREINGLPHDRLAADFIDLDGDGRLDAESIAKLRRLKTGLRNRLGEKSEEFDGNVYLYPAGWTGTGPTLAHLQTLGDDVYERLKGVILGELDRLDRSRDEDQENTAHELFGRARIDVFEGREDLLERIRAYIGGQDTHPLVLHGVSGSGKTALMAKAGVECREKAIGRFIGATPGSTNLRSLLADLCRQIGPRDGLLPSGIRELGKEFGRRLEQVIADQRLVVFLDGLDQLGESDGARSFWWLPVKLAARTRLIVSVLEADGLAGECGRRVMGRVPKENRLSVGPLPACEGQRALNEWLRRAGRRLQPEQYRDVLAKFSAPGNGLPLYLKLAFEEARRWRSYDGLPRGSDAKPGLGRDVPHILSDLLHRLKRDEHHGPLFTERALGYLAAGRQGLTEDELLDVLSQDEEVLHDFQERSPNSPVVTRLPFIVWSRLRADMERYLTERQVDNAAVLNFYHRHVRDAVETQCLSGDDGLRAHRRLAGYFRGQDYFLESIEEQRLLAKRVPPGARTANVRKADELLWQQLRGAQWDEVATLLTDVFFLEAKAEAGLVFQLALDFMEYLRDGPAEDPRRHHIELLHQALRRDVHFIAHRPNTLFQCLWNSGWWHDCAEAAQYYGSAAGPWNRLGDKLSTLLEAWRAQKEPATAGFPWLRTRLPPVVHPADAEYALFRGHSADVWAVAISPDGRKVVSGSTDCSACVWDVDSGLPLTTYRGHKHMVAGVAFSPDGRHVASASLDRTVHCWGASDGALKWVFDRHKDRALGVMFSPDGETLVTASADSTLRLVAAGDGKQLRVLRGHKGGVRCVAFSPDGERVVSGSDDNTVRLWDVRSGKQLSIFEELYGGVQAVSFAPDGRRIATGCSGGMVRVLEGGSETNYLKIAAAPIGGVAFSPDGAWLAIGSNTGTLITWDLKSKSELPAESGVTAVAISRDGKNIVSGAFDSTVRIWRRRDENRPPLRRAGPSSVSFAPGGRRALAHYQSDASLRLWDTKSFTEMANLGPGVNGVSYSVDGRWLAIGTNNKAVQVWDADQGVLHADLPGHTGYVKSVSLSSDGRVVVSASSDSTLRLWDAEAKSELAILRGHENDAVKSVSFSPDGRLIASVSNQFVCLWDRATATLVAKNPLSDGWAQAVRFSPDGRQFATTAFKPAGSSYIFHLWDARNGQEIAILWDVWDPSFSPDGRWIVCGRKNDAIVFEAPGGAPVATLQGHTGRVFGVAASPDGQRVASASRDSTVRVWDARTGECLEVIWGHADINTIVAGGAAFALRAVARQADTVIEDSETRQEVCSFPVAFDSVVTQPSGRTWVGMQESIAHIITMES